jgi:transcriptional regulator with XRE-family HTH domain
VGQRIKKLRLERKMSRDDFALMVGISGQHLGLVEKGKNGLSLSTMVNICDTTGASADYILFGAVDSAQEVAAIAAIDGLSCEQIEIGLDIIKKLAQLINTEGGNEVLIQELMRRQLLAKNKT